MQAQAQAQARAQARSCTLSWLPRRGILLDIVGSLPIDTVVRMNLLPPPSCFWGCGDDGYDSSSRMMCADKLRLLRLCRLTRTTKILELWTKLVDDWLVLVVPGIDSYSALVRNLALILLVAHLMSCLLFYVGGEDYDGPDCATGNSTSPCGWVSKQLQLGGRSNYIAALYYACA